VYRRNISIIAIQNMNDNKENLSNIQSLDIIHQQELWNEYYSKVYGYFFKRVFIKEDVEEVTTTNHPREEYPFQLSELISADELKPKPIITPQVPIIETKPRTPTIPNNPKITTSVALPRTGGEQNLYYVIAVLILTLISLNYKKSGRK
jgi:hypothetical protein